MAKKKGYESIKEWIKGITYHLYWCVMSSNPGDEEEIKEKWLSTIDHLQNNHEKCQTHGPGLKKKWFKPGNLVLCTVCLHFIKKISMSNSNHNLFFRY